MREDDMRNHPWLPAALAWLALETGALAGPSATVSDARKDGNGFLVHAVESDCQDGPTTNCHKMFGGHGYGW
jgi:hypothetical protein